jgi:ribosomal protein L37E
VNTTLTPELTTADRCDRCGAQAYIRARLPEGLELHFCAHHGRAHLDKLRDMQDIDILDETHKLHAEENPAI